MVQERAANLLLTVGPLSDFSFATDRFTDPICGHGSRLIFVLQVGTPWQELHRKHARQSQSQETGRKPQPDLFAFDVPDPSFPSFQ